MGSRWHLISILCSHTDCDSNNAQRLHFVYNIALCALPFLMLYLWYFANISLVITSILLCLLVRSSQQFYACLRFAPLFSSVPIIPHFAFAINLVLRLFTFYTSLPPDGKRAPTIIGRGSFPRSRTGCDIFNCIAALPASHIPQHFTAGKLSILCSHADCDSVPDSTVDRCHRFNLMWLRELCLTGLRPGELMGLTSILCSHTSCDKTALSDHDSLSTLCSHTDCDSNNAQRPHFVYNIALCALPFLML